VGTTPDKDNPYRSPPFDTRRYWDAISGRYQGETRIAVDDVHYGPLIPGERELRLFGEVGGLDMLELGCGGGQNSVALAKWGARCLGIDISPRQIEFARELAVRENVGARFVVGDIEHDLGGIPSAGFDWIHTAWGLSFVQDLEPVLRECRRILKPRGRLLLATGHPVFSGEWVQLDQGEEGVFVRNYFDPPADTRNAGDIMVAAFFHPIGRVIDWLTGAGFRLDRLVEPPARPLDESTPAPYESRSWEEMREPLRAIPVVAVYIATRLP
jgi:SAM-dependent methyltransferase